jgi:hypothetical protein
VVQMRALGLMSGMVKISRRSVRYTVTWCPHCGSAGEYTMRNEPDNLIAQLHISRLRQSSASRTVNGPCSLNAHRSEYYPRPLADQSWTHSGLTGARLVLGDVLAWK